MHGVHSLVTMLLFPLASCSFAPATEPRHRLFASAGVGAGRQGKALSPGMLPSLPLSPRVHCACRQLRGGTCASPACCHTRLCCSVAASTQPSLLSSATMPATCRYTHSHICSYSCCCCCCCDCGSAVAMPLLCGVTTRVVWQSGCGTLVYCGVSSPKCGRSFNASLASATLAALQMLALLSSSRLCCPF